MIQDAEYQKAIAKKRFGVSMRGRVKCSRIEYKLKEIAEIWRPLLKADEMASAPFEVKVVGCFVVCVCVCLALGCGKVVHVRGKGKGNAVAASCR